MSKLPNLPKNKFGAFGPIWFFDFSSLCSQVVFADGSPAGFSIAVRRPCGCRFSYSSWSSRGYSIAADYSTKRGGRKIDLPLDEFPNFRLQRAGVLADFGKDRDGLLQVFHRRLCLPGVVQQIGEIVVQRGLAMSVALRLA